MVKSSVSSVNKTLRSVHFGVVVVELIDLVTVFDAILTSRQTCEKLHENIMSNNFRKTAVLKKISIVN